MENAMTELMTELLVDAGFEPFSYSGRGMYGSKCVAVQLEGVELGEFLAAYMIAARDSEVVEEAAEVIRSLRTDALGMGQVVYFPQLPWAA